ncbi:fungal zn(2)-Cys(6) binuclear cluster domain-containing protein [Trichoderma breve]|uniref:Fungal zn(2)-Cys(6) binuclear cluster domain-containing protein n=1 Tax=Trichoderma breve TaxID=2034170 RepID=A0A9W9EFC1_9HYPO|nr:fungal zn(2)-Cys(6) binuclear cluster domain-containing protein [Trichoderma breve]KAJ4865698.1 fungal zn(2)-Cys(6) binuclear cluster domain-containing protein [Trichoderma breve]
MEQRPQQASLRPLLPRSRDENSHSSGDASPSDRRARPRKRRTVVAVACESCRRHKSKCDAVRPQCSLCVARGRDCIYTAEPDESRGSALKRKYSELEKNMQQLQQTHASLQGLVDALRFRDQGDVEAVLRRLRQGQDVESIARQIQTGDLLLQMRLSPETRFRHVLPYRSQMPLQLLTAHNPYLNSSLYEATFASPESDMSMSIPPSSSSSALRRGEHRPQYLKPYVAASIVDPRLDAVKPSAWTTVSSDDHLMRKLLSLYFSHEFLWLNCFHKDLFLEDMLSGSTRFCSSLLVNAVLTQACSCCRTFSDRLEYWNPDSLGYRFFAEARRLWELEAGQKSSITTVQAGMVINIIYNMYSMDKIGMTYDVQAIAMAHDLKLFDGPTSKNRRKQRGYDFTAWSIFFWMNLQCYHFIRSPLFKVPPKAPLPDPDKDPEWYGEIWVKYPLNQTPIQMNFPHFFKAKCELGVIVTQIAVDLFDAEERDGTRDPRESVAGYLEALESWSSSLPISLNPTEIVFPFHLKLHLTYHNIVINLCEVTTPDGDAKIPAQADGGVRWKLHLSRISFETIVRLYYLRHGFENADAYMAHCLTVLAFMGVAQLAASTTPSLPAPTSPEEARSTLILAAKGLGEQGQNYYLPFTLFHIVQGQMGSDDLNALQSLTTACNEDVGTPQIRARHVQAQYPVNIVNMTDYPQNQRLGSLIKEYSELAIVEAASPSTSDLSNTP